MMSADLALLLFLLLFVQAELWYDLFLFSSSCCCLSKRIFLQQPTYFQQSRACPGSLALARGTFAASSHVYHNFACLLFLLLFLFFAKIQQVTILPNCKHQRLLPEQAVMCCILYEHTQCRVLCTEILHLPCKSSSFSAIAAVSPSCKPR